MNTYLGRIVLLVLLQNVAYSKVYYYLGYKPDVFVKFSADDEELKIADIELETFETFFIELKCAKVYNCTKQKTPETKAYDGNKYPGTPTGNNPDIFFGGATLHTTEYKGYLSSDITDADDETLFKVVESSTKPFFIANNGIIGLNVDPNNPESQVIKLFNNMKKNKQIIVRRGPFFQTLRDRQMNRGLHGHIAIDEAKLNGCGNFTYMPTEGSGWQVKASVKIGEQTYTNQIVGFSFHKTVEAPTDVYNKQFKSVTDPDKLPALTLIHSGHEFTVNRSTFENYYDNVRKTLSVYANENKNGQFLLGENFLSNWCIALKADDAVKKFEIGLAPMIALKDDPKWSKLDDNGGDGKGGGDKDKATSTAVLSVWLIVAVFFSAKMFC